MASCGLRPSLPQFLGSPRLRCPRKNTHIAKQFLSIRSSGSAQGHHRLHVHDKERETDPHDRGPISAMAMRFTSRAQRSSSMCVLHCSLLEHRGVPPCACLIVHFLFLTGRTFCGNRGLAPCSIARNQSGRLRGAPREFNSAGRETVVLRLALVLVFPDKSIALWCLGAAP